MSPSPEAVVPESPGLSAPDQDARRLRHAFLVAAAFVGLLWAIKLLELASGIVLISYGVYPLRWDGLPGILLGPLLHGSVAHLLANTAPLLVLGTALLYGYPRAAPIVLPVVYLGAGLGVWLFARPAYHLGASGLSFGMLFFLFTMGALRWDRRAIALALAVFLLYGGMIWGIFPTAPDISFEYHFFGALLGIILALLLRRVDPPPPATRYSWEDEEVDDWPFNEPGASTDAAESEEKRHLH